MPNPSFHRSNRQSYRPSLFHRNIFVVIGGSWISIQRMGFLFSVDVIASLILKFSARRINICIKFETSAMYYVQLLSNLQQYILHFMTIKPPSVFTSILAHAHELPTNYFLDNYLFLQGNKWIETIQLARVLFSLDRILLQTMYRPYIRTFIAFFCTRIILIKSYAWACNHSYNHWQTLTETPLKRQHKRRIKHQMASPNDVLRRNHHIKAVEVLDFNTVTRRLM